MSARLHRACFGATLVEGIVVMLISTLFLSVLPGFHLAYVKVWQRETARMGTSHRADFALRRMHDDVVNARSVAISTDGCTLTLVQPARSYDATLGKQVNLLNADGLLQDGDGVQYYLVSSPQASSGATMYRRVSHPDGSTDAARVVATFLHPELNTYDSGSGQPLFSFDPALRTVSVVVTAAEPKPSSGTFAPTTSALECTKDHGQVVRLATEEHPEGQLRCSVCGPQVRPSGELVTYQTQLALRNR